MILQDQLRLKMLEVTNERDYRLMLENDPDALYPPWFFTWVENQKLSAFAWPQTRGNLDYLWQDGVRHIITLCPEKVPQLAEFNFSWTYIPIQECHAPTIDEIFKFTRTVQWCRKRNLPIGIHDRMGLGRTGVMVSVYLMYFHGMEADQALKNLRYIRPGSVDSQVQEDCILNYRPNAKIANEKRIKRITKTSDHFLSILRNQANDVLPPWNFSWVVEQKLAAMSCPSTEGNMTYLWQNHIRHLVTLSPEKVPPKVDFQIESTFIPVEEFEAPSLNDINKFIVLCKESLERNEAVGVHCRMGRGRTGVMAACYLVYFKDMHPQSAIGLLRQQRPGSVETFEQERIVHRYHDFLRGTRY